MVSIFTSLRRFCEGFLGVTMSDQNPLNKKQIADELDEFHQELGYCIAFWTGIEVELLNTLRMCMPEVDFQTLAGSFYAVDNFRSKLGMVDTALGVVLEGDATLDQWSGKGGLLQRITAASKKRNNLAHWMVLNLSAMKKPPSIYLIPNIFRADMKNFVPTRPTGGYYLHDLKNIRKEFKDLADDLQFFWIEWRGPPEMLQVLKQQRQGQPMNLAPEDPTPEGTSPPPQSSQG